MLTCALITAKQYYFVFSYIDIVRRPVIVIVLHPAIVSSDMCAWFYLS